MIVWEPSAFSPGLLGVAVTQVAFVGVSQWLCDRYIPHEPSGTRHWKLDYLRAIGMCFIIEFHLIWDLENLGFFQLYERDLGSTGSNKLGVLYDRRCPPSFVTGAFDGTVPRGVNLTRTVSFADRC